MLKVRNVTSHIALSQTGS